MRIRSIRPEFWSSEDVAAMDWHTRLVFVGLWSYVDDNGVGRDVEPLIVAALFPLDGDLPESSRRVTGALRHLSDHGQITRYRVDGKPYLHVAAWEKHQRIEKKSTGRYPLPTSEDAEIREPSPTTPGALPEPSAPGEGEKGRRGGVLSSDESDDDEPDLFADFYSAYPRKEAKRKAEQAWRAAIKRADPAKIMAGLERFPFNEDRRFVPLPASWLNADRWADETLPPNTPGIATDGHLPGSVVESLIGPDVWTPPDPPAGMGADEGWEWQRQRRLEHIADRQRLARERMGRAAS